MGSCFYTTEGYAGRALLTSDLTSEARVSINVLQQRLLFKKRIRILSSGDVFVKATNTFHMVV